MALKLENFIPGVQYNGVNTDKDAAFGADVSVAGDLSVTGTLSLAQGGLVTLSASDITTVSTSAIHTVGTEGIDASGNRYIFLKGVASTVAGDWVSFNGDFETARGAGSDVGQIAIAMAAVVASRWGWYQVYGDGSAKVVATGGVRVYTSAVTGQLLATVVTGALVHGMFTVSGNGNTVTGSLTDVRLDYPYVDRASGSY